MSKKIYNVIKIDFPRNCQSYGSKSLLLLPEQKAKYKLSHGDVYKRGFPLEKNGYLFLETELIMSTRSK